MQEDARLVFISLFNSSQKRSTESNGFYFSILRDSKVQRELTTNMIERLFYLRCFRQMCLSLITKEKLMLKWSIHLRCAASLLIWWNRFQSSQKSFIFLDKTMWKIRSLLKCKCKIYKYRLLMLLLNQKPSRKLQRRFLGTMKRKLMSLELLTKMNLLRKMIWKVWNLTISSNLVWLILE